MKITFVTPDMAVPTSRWLTAEECEELKVFNGFIFVPQPPNFSASLNLAVEDCTGLHCTVMASQEHSASVGVYLDGQPVHNARLDVPAGEVRDLKLDLKDHKFVCINAQFSDGVPCYLLNIATSEED